MFSAIVPWNNQVSCSTIAARERRSARDIVATSTPSSRILPASSS
jgi:hypothetical protein